jgi:hypothetical protein
MKAKLCSFIFSVLIISSCDRIPESLNGQDYALWLASGDSELAKKQKVNDITVSTRFVPAEYLAYKEFISSSDSVSFDSLLNSYKCGLTFQIAIEAPKTSERYRSLNYFNISTPQELADRIQFLSFHADEFISLQHNGVNYSPVLSNFEGFDELGNRLLFTVVFQITEYNCGVVSGDFNDVSLIFDDPYWELGTLNFLFKKKYISTVPKLRL